jgi:hypothetical protein
MITEQNKLGRAEEGSEDDMRYSNLQHIIAGILEKDDAVMIMNVAAWLIGGVYYYCPNKQNVLMCDIVPKEDFLKDFNDLLGKTMIQFE